jgi:hypothetical protein
MFISYIAANFIFVNDNFIARNITEILLFGLSENYNTQQQFVFGIAFKLKLLVHYRSWMTDKGLSPACCFPKSFILKAIEYDF